MGLFGKKKKDVVVDENPYAAPVTPYQQARANLAQPPKPSGPISAGALPSAPRTNSLASSTAPPPYPNSNESSRFADEKYGNQNGYGSNRYDNDNDAGHGKSQPRSGGYGGFGDDADNGALFGGASSRYVPPAQGPNGSAPTQSTGGRHDSGPANSLLGNAQDRYNPTPQAPRPAADDEYGGYGAPRELTEEERDRQEARAINAETRAVRKAGVDSLARSKAAARQALELSASTAARIGEQGERLHRTERNVDAALVMARESEGKTKELKKINGSMFSGLVGPSKKTLNKKDAETLRQYQEDKEIRENTRKEGYQSEQHMDQMFNNRTPGLLGSRTAVNKKMVFRDEDDSDEEERRLADEDEADEQQINDDVDELMGMVSTLKFRATATGKEIQHQTEMSARIGQKTDAVDDRVRMNREKLSRIR